MGRRRIARRDVSTGASLPPPGKSLVVVGTRLGTQIETKMAPFVVVLEAVGNFTYALEKRKEKKKKRIRFIDLEVKF